MENYNNYAASYPESGDSSPRSREIEFENPPPWEDPNHPPNYKVKFMCSYGGKIHPRPHDNQLAYVGGETKILAVDRTIKFTSLISKLSGLCDADGVGVTFKYQLPGEDLDALISVTNDDDLEHMMHEYDRLYRASPKPARLRLFLFSTSSSSQRSFGSEEGRSEKERFVEALNSGTPPPPAVVAPPREDNVDFLFGLEKGLPAPPPQSVVAPPPMQGKMEFNEGEVQAPGVEDPIQKHIQDLQRIRLEEQQGLYRRKSDDNLAGGYSGGDYYVQKVPEKVAQIPGSGQIPSGYWPEKQIPGGGVYHGGGGATLDQQFYMMPPPPGVGAYHPPQMIRPMNPGAGTTQGYYAVQRMPPEVYREQQQVYNSSMPPPVAAAPPSLPQGQGAPRVSLPGMGMVDPVQYSQMMYEGGVGRQVYYNAPGGQLMSGQTGQAPQGAGGLAPQYQPLPAELKQGGGFSHEGGKIGPKATQASV